MTPKGGTACFICGADPSHDHHIIAGLDREAMEPGLAALAEAATVPLCDRCHSHAPGHPASLIRGHSLSWHAREVKRRAQGLQVGGGARLGYRWQDGQVVLDEREQECLARLTALWSEGRQHADIAAQLNAEGFTTRRHGWERTPWTARSVAGRCGRLGLYRYGPRRKAA
jgi:hypothetical protein